VTCAHPAMSNPNIRNAATIVCFLFIIMLLKLDC
jgi:hypothetical protein